MHIFYVQFVISTFLLISLYNHAVKKYCVPFVVSMWYRNLPFCGKIRLLDAGSCYNPFQAFAEFSAVGIDICPAVNVCFCCL